MPTLRGNVDFTPKNAGPFVECIIAEAEIDERSAGLLANRSDSKEQVSSRGFISNYVAPTMYDSDGVYYSSRLQVSHFMCARRDALKYLPEGLNEETSFTVMPTWRIARDIVATPTVAS